MIYCSPLSNRVTSQCFLSLLSLVMAACGADREPADQERADQEPVDQEPVDQEPVDQEPIDQEPVDQEPIDQEPVDQEPADTEGKTGGCSDVYDDDVLPTFGLEFTPQELEGLEQDCASNTKQYRPVTLEYGAERVPAMVRLKGNWSWRCDKMQFVISFNETDSKGRFHGLRKLVLDAAWYDPTLVGERLGASFLKRMGVTASCVNNAKLYINGDYYGVYSNVERLDKEYLDRRFERR